MKKPLILLLLVIVEAQVFGQCLPKTPVNLPVYENFEDAYGSYVGDKDSVHCDSVFLWDFTASSQQYSRLRFNIGFSNKSFGLQDHHAATFDQIGYSGFTTKYLIGTLDMSSYDTAFQSHAVMSFYQLDHGGSHQPDDAVWIRGSNLDNWIKVYNLDSLSVTGNWVKSNPIDLTGILQSNQQNFSTTFQVRFGHVGDDIVLSPSFHDGMSIDDILIEEVNCPSPFNFSISNIQSHSAQLHTKALDSVEIEYGLCGFTPGSGITALIDGGNQQTSLTGLLSDTCFEVYIRRRCNPGNSSGWVGPITFNTFCEALLAPFIENFETSNSQIPPNCWINETIDGVSDWNFDTQTSQLPTALNGDHTNGTWGGGIMAWLDDSHDADSTHLLSPLIDVSNLNIPELSFWIWSTTNSGNPVQQFPLHIDVRDRFGWHHDVAVIDAETTGWEQYMVDLSHFGDTLQIRFSGEDLDDGYYKDLALDDIEVKEGPTCPVVYHKKVKANQIADTTFSFSWKTPTNSTAFEMRIGKGRAFLNDSTGQALNAIITNDSVVIDTFSYNTCYGYMLRSICSAGDTSEWTGPFYFCTSCKPVSFPYYESFDDRPSPNLPNCWSTYPANDNLIRTDTTDHGAVVPSMPYALELNERLTDHMIISPEFNNLADPTHQIRAMIAYENPFTGNADTLFFGSLTDPTSPGTFKILDTLLPSDVNTNFQEFTFRLDDTATIGGDRYVAFQYAGGGVWEYYVDDFYFEKFTACEYPTNPSTSYEDCGNIEIDWTSYSGGSVIEYGPNGFTKGQGVFSGVVTPPHTITGLNSNTTYDFYIADTCYSDTSYAEMTSGKTTAAKYPTATFNHSHTVQSSKYELWLDATASTNAIYYYWDFGNGLTGTGARDTVTYYQNDNGPQTITLVTSSGCETDTFSLTVMVDIGIADVDLNHSLLVFPNPTDKKLNVSFSSAFSDQAVIRLCDIQGREVLKQKLSTYNGTFSKEMDISQIGAGIYLLEVTAENQKAYEKLVIH